MTLHRWQFEQFREAASALPSQHPVHGALDSAEENANQTVTTEWGAVALDSIAFTPEFTENREVRDWFAANGYCW